MKSFHRMLLISAAALACALPVLAQDATPEVTPETTTEAPTIPYYMPTVVAQIAHSEQDFTQGLVWSDGRLFQSTGSHGGGSRLQELDPATGEVLREQPISTDAFAEGLALVGDTLIQLTWQNEEAYRYDVDTFEQTGTSEYTGEGWGLCYDGQDLWMSDGSANLFRRDPETFELLDTVPVTAFGQPIDQLNELECANDSVYANIWYSDLIVQIDPATGDVIGVIDGSQLLSQDVRMTMDQGAVLNGIAYIPERDTFLLTGKLWPAIFEVTLEQVGELVQRGA